MTICRSTRDESQLRRAHPPASSYDPAFASALEKISAMAAELEGPRADDSCTPTAVDDHSAEGEAVIERLLAALPERGSVVRRRLFSKNLVAQQPSRQTDALRSEEGTLLQLTQSLLIDARSRMATDLAVVAEGLGLARLTLETLPLEGCLPSGLIEDLHAETWAAEALLAVARGEIASAQHRVRWARALVLQGTGDPLTEAEVEIADGLTHWLAGAPREAEAHLRQAWHLLSAVEQMDRQASVLLAIAWLLDQRGESQGAARAREAVATLRDEPHQSPERLHQLVDLLSAAECVETK